MKNCPVIRMILFFTLVGLCLAGPALSAREADTGAIRAVIRDYLDNAPVPGLACVVVDARQVLFSQGFGVREAGSNRPMTDRTPVGIASITEGFTALAILRLADAGKLSLDQKVTEILPWFRTADKAKSDRITIRMLLTMTAGLPDSLAFYFNPDQGPQALENGVRQLASTILIDEPGAIYNRSHTAYDILGLIVSQVTGQSFEDYLQTQVLARLGLKEASLDPAAIEKLDSAGGNFIHFYGFTPAPRFYRRVSAPSNGAMVASASDLGLYLRALLSGSFADGRPLLSPQGLAALFTPATLIPAGSISAGASSGQDERGAIFFRHAEAPDASLDLMYGGTQWTSCLVMLDRPRGLACAIVFPYEARHLDPYRFVTPLNLGFNVLRAARGLPPSDWARPKGQDPLLVEGTPQPATGAAWAKYLPATLSGDDGGTMKAWIENGRVLTLREKAGHQLFQYIKTFGDARGLNDSLLYTRKVSVLYDNAGVPEYLTINGTKYYFDNQDIPKDYQFYPGPGSAGDLLLPSGLTATHSEAGLEFGDERFRLGCQMVPAIAPDLASYLESARPPQRSSPRLVRLSGGWMLCQQSFQMDEKQAVMLIGASRGAAHLLFRLTAPPGELGTLAQRIAGPLFRFSRLP